MSSRRLLPVIALALAAAPAQGINAELEMYWNDGYTIITLANYDRAASQAAEQIRSMIFGGTIVRR